MNAKATVIIFLDNGNDVEDFWTEVARGSTREELLLQLRDYFGADESQESTGPPASLCEALRAGPPTFMIHVEGETEDEDFLLFKESLENVARIAAGKIEDTNTSEAEDRKEIEEIWQARKQTDSEVPETETDILKVA